MTPTHSQFHDVISLEGGKKGKPHNRARDGEAPKEEATQGQIPCQGSLHETKDER